MSAAAREALARIAKSLCKAEGVTRGTWQNGFLSPVMPVFSMEYAQLGGRWRASRERCFDSSRIARKPHWYWGFVDRADLGRSPWGFATRVGSNGTVTEVRTMSLLLHLLPGMRCFLLCAGDRPPFFSTRRHFRAMRLGARGVGLRKEARGICGWATRGSLSAVLRMIGGLSGAAAEDAAGWKPALPGHPALRVEGKCPLPGWAASLTGHRMLPRTTQQNCRPRVSDGTVVGALAKASDADELTCKWIRNSPFRCLPAQHRQTPAALAYRGLDAREGRSLGEGVFSLGFPFCGTRRRGGRGLGCAQSHFLLAWDSGGVAAGLSARPVVRPRQMSRVR